MKKRLPLAAMLFALVLITALPAVAGSSRPVIDNNDTVLLAGNTSYRARPENDIGSADPQLPMEKMILALKLSPSRQAALDKFLADQQDPASPHFHCWLTPEQFGRKFGASREDLKAVTDWLESQNFTIDEVAKGRMWINFSGAAVDVERAFHTEIHDYLVDGRIYHANAKDPSIPRALADVVAGVVSLNSFPRTPMNAGFHALSPEDAAAVAAKAGGISPEWSGTANGTAGVYASPLDWATIYDANASFSANGTGTGVVIGIVGRTNPGTANWATFRSTLGLPVNTPTIIVNGTNPGDLGAGEDGEADLDAEWSGGCAPGATVKFVASKSTSSTDGVDLSAQYIVNNNLADVMSTSFGQCESSMGSTENTFYNNLWSQAASQGITSCVSTGDSGAAGCASGSASSGSGQSGVNGLASTPYNIAVGATQLSSSSSYWNGSGNAVSYIPETPWNESGSVSGGSGLWATSSGASSTYAKPSWQVCTGVPSASHRYLPDVCLDGSDMFFGNYGMLVYTQGAMATTGGTSAASPSFAGVMALVVQKYGRQGNANTKLYPLGAAQYNGTGPAVFHDITSGNNNVPGLTGCTATTAWDEVTGLGTVDVDALVNNWGGTTTTYSISGTITLSGSGLSGVTVAAGGASTTTNSSGAYTLSGLANGAYTVTPSLSGYTFTPASASETVNSANITGVNFTATAVTSTYSISGTITLSGSGLSGVAVTAGAKSATTNSSGAYTISGLANGSYTVTPSLSGYTFTPASASETLNGANITGVNFTAATSGGGGGTSTLLSDGFESGGWSSAQVSGTAGKWTSVTSSSYPSVSAHGGTHWADFNSYTSSSGSETRYYRATGFAVPSNTTSLTLTFWMYHDTGYSSDNDRVQAQVSTNGSTWTNVGSAVSRYNGSTGWAQVTMSLGTGYNGAANLQLGFLGISAYGNDCYIDDVAVVAQTGTPPPTYSMSGTVTLSGSGLSGVKVTAGTASATTGSTGAYTISGLSNATYTVTPSLSGYTFTPASASETVNGANIAGVNFTATQSAGPTTLFSDGFESAGWSVADTSGTAGNWTLVTSSKYPSISAHGGTHWADFNSYTSASGSQTRLYKPTGFAVASTYSTVTLTFWMYHDTGYSSYPDKIQPQVSTNGSTWTNLGSAIARYNGSTGWAQVTLDLSAYKGQTVYLGFLGISGYGNDEYLDDVLVVAQ